jgi:primosomal protein N'
VLVLIAPFKQSFDDKGLTYTVPENLREEITLGAFVEISIGSKNTFGIIIDIDAESNYDTNKLKSISKIIP